MTKIPLVNTATDAQTLHSDDSVVAKTNLLGMTQDQLGAYFKSLGEKPFRASQVMKWIYQHGVTDFSQMTNLSKGLREKLLKRLV